MPTVPPTPVCKTTDLVRLKILMVRETGTEVPVLISTPTDASKYADSLRDYDRECVAAILLTTKNRAIALHEFSIGILDAAIVSPANVMKAALLANAAALILVHNHPSRDPTPSAEDIRITRQMIEAGKVMSIRVLDHVILGGEGQFTSLRESGMVAFEG